MDPGLFERESDYRWALPPRNGMHVPAVIYADRSLIKDMDDKVLEQLRNVARLPGIVKAAYAMPDAHWGYGFPIGGVAAFDPDAGGIVSAGGVGFDISCGVRALLTGCNVDDICRKQTALADELSVTIPAGLGSRGRITLDEEQMNRMLQGGARWAVAQGYGAAADLDHIEESGCIAGADPDCVSERAKHRQRREMGTLGSGNHYLEVQKIAQVHDTEAAMTFGVREGEVIISIHCGSRGLGHQIGTEYLKDMALGARGFGIDLPDRELACAPIRSDLGQQYLGAMRAAMNCALANRQILTHLTREAFAVVLPQARLEILYDVSHNICKEEWHNINGERRHLFVHRKGATRAFGPDDPAIPDALKPAGQPVLIGGSMGTCSYILAGTKVSETLAFSSACHGAGRAMSRRKATKKWRGRAVVDELAERGILIRSPSLRGVAEEAPGAYKDVSEVVDITERSGLARIVARLEPMICIKG